MWCLRRQERREVQEEAVKAAERSTRIYPFIRSIPGTNGASSLPHQGPDSSPMGAFCILSLRETPRPYKLPGSQTLAPPVPPACSLVRAEVQCHLALPVR